MQILFISYPISYPWWLRKKNRSCLSVESRT